MIYLNYEQAKKLLDCFGGDETAIISIASGNGHSGDGIYVGVAEYPEEGAVYLGKQAG